MVWVLSLGTVFSFNLWRTPLLGDRTFFDLLDHLTSNIMLPLVSLGTALFAGWLVSQRRLRQALNTPSPAVFQLWYLTIRYIAPVAIVLVFLSATGFLTGL